MKPILALAAITCSLLLSPNVYAAPEGGWGGGPKKKFEEAIAKLPKEKAEIVSKAFDKLHESRKAERDVMKAEHEKLRAILTAETFDKNAYIKQSDVLKNLKQKHEDAMRGTVLEVAPQLNQAERKILVEALPQPGKHGPRGLGRDEPKHDDSKE